MTWDKFEKISDYSNLQKTLLNSYGKGKEN
jgi:hypothetical protein